MKKTALGIPVRLMMVGLALFGCTTGGAPSATHSRYHCADGYYQLCANYPNYQGRQALLFSDTVDGGGLHIICLGHDQQCDTMPRDPQL